MKLISAALVGAGLLALTACGGGATESNASGEATDTVNVASDDLALDNALATDTLGNEANALGTDANLGVDANLTTDGNLAADANAAATDTVNSQ